MVQIFIWDLKNPTNNPYSPGTRSQKLEDVTTLAWNRQVVYILATASNNGNTVIWDLRNRREVITLTHPGGRRPPITGIAWNPDNVFEGHTKSALAVSWCSKDSDLIVSCGKDNRTIVWNGASGQCIGDLDISDNWAFDAQWCPRNPELVCVASFDGKVSIHSIQSSGTQAPAEPQAQVPDSGDPFQFIGTNRRAGPQFTLPHPPKWLRRPSGATWGFGGKLVSFGVKAEQRTVSVKTVVTEPDLVRRALELSEVLNNGSIEKFEHFCSTRGALAGSPHEKEVWTFLGLMFESSAREQILKFLGFSREDIGGSRLGPLMKKILGDYEERDAAKEDEVTAAKPFTLFTPAKGEESDIDYLISRSLIMGDFESAVKLCFATNRPADALMLAICGGPDLVKYAQDQYLKKAKDSRGYMRVLSSVLRGDLQDVVEQSNLESYDGAWKDILAMICTYGKTEELARLFSIVGERLQSRKIPPSSRSKLEENELGMTLCFLGAGDLQRVSKLWMPRDAASESLQSFVEKTVVFRKAVNFVDANLTHADGSTASGLSTLYDRLFKYAQKLSEQGLLDVAWRILENVPEGVETQSSNEIGVAILKDRVYRSGHIVSSTTQAPKVPYAITGLYTQPAALNSYDASQNVSAYPSSSFPQYDQYQYSTQQAVSSTTNGYGSGYGSVNSGWNNSYHAKPVVPIPPVPAPFAGNDMGANPPPTSGFSSLASIIPNTNVGQVTGFNDPPAFGPLRSGSKPPTTVLSPFGNNAGGGYGHANATAYQNNVPGQSNSTWQTPSAAIPPPPLAGFTPPPAATRGTSSSGVKFNAPTGATAAFAPQPTDHYAGTATTAVTSSEGAFYSSQPPMARMASGPPPQERTLTGGSGQGAAAPSQAAGKQRFRKDTCYGVIYFLAFGDRSQIPASQMPLVTSLDSLIRVCREAYNNVGNIAFCHSNIFSLKSAGNWKTPRNALRS
ncbi:protein transport protein S31 [Phlyctochytrium bullatum]|nr:protein transport protein S31 [Phlyctochytrium bullatum]